MKPNILFLVIDGFRSDKCFGSKKSSKTPNLDSIIKSGTNFTQSISTADQTGLSLSSVFTALFPPKSGITQFNFTSKTPTYFDILQKSGYQLNAFVPDVQFFLELISNFDEKTAYDFEDKSLWKRLEGGLGTQILETLSSNKMKQPWMYYIHLMDARYPFYVPTDFNKEEFGNTSYDKMISALDTWIGKIIQKLDLQNTLLIISSDHGEYIPVTGERITEIPKVQNIIRKGTKVPFLKQIGLKTMINLRFAAQTYRKEKLKRVLSPFEMRSFNTRGTLYLFDELVRVPLIFSGYKIPSSKTIDDMVRSIDIMPTILEICEIVDPNQNIDGRSLVPLFQNKNLNEFPAYMETGINLGLLTQKNPKTLGNVVGVRTSKYKYFRSRNDPKQDQTLFDLQNDPQEENNISNSHPEIVKEMEKILDDFINFKDKPKFNEMSQEEMDKIKDELMKLGYI